MVAREDMFDDREAEARAALVAAGADVDAVEALGQTRQMFRRDAGAMIADAQAARAALHVDVDLDVAGLRARAAIFDGVFEQVFDDPQQLVRSPTTIVGPGAVMRSTVPLSLASGASVSAM